MPTDRIVLVADVDQGVPPPAILDLAAVAQQMADKDTGDVRWLVVGNRAAAAAAGLAGPSGYPATALEIPSGTALNGELAGSLLQPLLADLQPDVVVLRHTARCQDFAAALAIALEAAYVAGIQGIVAHSRGFHFLRAVLGGRLVAEIATDGRPVVLTVMPGCFKHDGRSDGPAAIDVWQPELPATRSQLIEIRRSESEASLHQAETIVAAGRGIGSPDNLAWIQRLADRLPCSAVAGSRIVCDAGWLPYDRQVGVTGATVAPRLYLACGISGAPQHIGGMQGAEMIVAINKDPNAVIFNLADIGVVEDLEVFLPLLIKALDELQSATD